MKNTFFNDDHAQITDQRVVSYRNVGDNKFKRYVQDFDGHGDGGMISTINDLFLWDQNFYHKRVGGEEFINLMLSRRTLNNGYVSTYAFGLEHGNYKGLDIVTHGGNFLGFNHHFTRFPDQKFSVIVLANNQDIDPYFITDRISDIFLASKYTFSTDMAEPQPDVLKLIELENEELQQYSGTYWNSSENFSRNIYVKNDTLRFDRGMNNESLLVPIANDEFKMLVGGDVSVKFGGVVEGARQMRVNINDNSFFDFNKYEPASYDAEELARLSGAYYSAELDCVYELKMKDGALMLYVDSKENSVLNPVMENLFTNDFVGTITFRKESPNEFVIKSNRLRGVLFSRQR